MTINTCPDHNNENWKRNVELFGESAAHAIWLLSGGKNPTDEEAFKLLHSEKVEVIESLQAWDTGTYSGKPQEEYEPIIDKLILSDPNSKVGGGESFNQVKQRAIRAGMEIMQQAPYNSKVVLNSSILKFIMLWDKAGRPTDWGSITAEKYLALHTKPGEVVRMNGFQGQKIEWVRHGMTDQNNKKLLRDDDALLVDEGKKEAKRIGEKFSHEEIPMLYSSPLPRTLQTADRILMKQPLPEYPQELIEQQVREEEEYKNSPEYIRSLDDSGIPSSKTALRAVPRSVYVAQTPKAMQEWNKLQKGNITFEQFLNNSQFPKEQKPLLQDIYNTEHPKTIDDLITSFAAKYSYTVEINTTKTTNTGRSYSPFEGGYAEDIFEYNGDKYAYDSDDGFCTKNNQEISFSEFGDAKRAMEAQGGTPTRYYSNMTVPGGTNGSYRELDIQTPGITPSIQSHAQFADKGKSIGWYRVDDKETNIDTIYEQLKKSGQLKVIC